MNQPPSPLLLGIDIGTSSVKSVLFDAEQAAILAVAGQEYPLHKPAPDRAEQDPDDWWRAAVQTTRHVLEQAGYNEVAAIGLSGQMHGTILLNRRYEVIHPAIIWADQRSAEFCNPLIATLGHDDYLTTTGTLPAAGFMGPTLLWLAEHQPALLERTHKIILPKDYVRSRLVGEVATDISDAAATGLFDIAGGGWASSILEAAGLRVDWFPTVMSSTDVAGWLNRDAADQLGLEAGIPVVAGCADQPAQAIANGLIAPGKASVTIGSGGQVFVPITPKSGHSRIPTDHRLHVFNHAVPDTWYILGATLTAGLSLRWLRNILGLGGQDDAYATLSTAAGDVSPGADGLIFLPYLSGERTPHMDPLARGAFIGLNYHHGRGHMARAVMEGVTLSVRQALEISLELSGPVGTFIAAGGAAESAVWRQMQADILGVSLRKSLLIEQSGLGAAMLAGVGTGIYGSFEEASDCVTRYDPPVEPDQERQAAYDARYEHFCELYSRLRQDFHRLARSGE